MFQRTIAVITIGSLLSACATAGVFNDAPSDDGDGKDDDPTTALVMVTATVAVTSFVLGVMDAREADAPRAEAPLATNRRERKILRQAATGQCSAAVKAYQALRTTDLAAAGRLKLDDKLSTCIALEDARARGTIRSLGHD